MTSKTLCSNLWGHAVVDFSQQRTRACCKTFSLSITNEEVETLGKDIFLNHSVLIADRKEMLAGGKPERCNVCWKMEDEGSFSYRDGPAAWEKYFEPYKDNTTDFTRSEFPDNLDIQLDNYCDLKCIYCNEEFSTQWESEKIKYNDYLIPRSTTAHPELENIFFDWFEERKMSFTKRIAFLGGEPLISPIFYNYFERILNAYQGVFPPILEFNIITNLNTSQIYMDKFWALLETYAPLVKINVNISMESWGPRAELIRSNVNFERFVNNFERLGGSHTNIILSTITSVNLLCLSSLADYLRFILDLERRHNRPIIIYPNLVSNPEWLTVGLAPSSFFDRYIKECIELLRPFEHHRTYFEFLQTLESKFNFKEHKGSELHMRFIREIDKIATRRNVSYQKTFQEYGYIWDASLEP